AAHNKSCHPPKPPESPHRSTGNLAPAPQSPPPPHEIPVTRAADAAGPTLQGSAWPSLHSAHSPAPPHPSPAAAAASALPPPHSPPTPPPRPTSIAASPPPDETAARILTSASLPVLASTSPISDYLFRAVPLLGCFTPRHAGLNGRPPLGHCLEKV